MFSELTILGHLGRDPELRYTPSGRAVTDFPVAANRRYPAGSSERVKETLWCKVTAWGRLAETTNEFLAKGRLVLVKGRLQADPATGGPRIYTRRDGTLGAAFELTAARVLFLDGTPDAGEDAETGLPGEEAVTPI